MSSVPPQGPGSVPPPPPPPPPQSPYMPSPAGAGLAWETQAIGPQPFLDTAMLFIKAPEQAWRQTRETGDYTRPLLFGVIAGWVGFVFRAIWGTMFRAGLSRIIPAQYAGMLGGGGSLVGQVILGPLFVAIGLFVGAAILHVSFMIVGALTSSKSQFEGTFRLLCYASVANVANVVPLLGGLVAGLWAAYLIVIGAQQMHKTTQGKALFGILLPTIVCCVCIAVGSIFAGAALMRAFSR